MLYGVRHGQTDWNRQERAQGRADQPLNDLGRQQACDNAGRLGLCLAERGLDAAAVPIYSSPLARATETAAIMRMHLGNPGPVRVDERLIELDFGRWEGMTAAEMKADDPQRRRARRDDRWHVAPPGGESYSELFARVGQFVPQCPRPAIVVTHLGVLRLLAAIICGVPRDEALSMSFRNDVVYIYERGGLSICGGGLPC